MELSEIQRAIEELSGDQQTTLMAWFRYRVRQHRVSCKLDHGEYLAVKDCAAKAGVSLGNFLRSVLGFGPRPSRPADFTMSGPASLPPREEILAKLLFLIDAPAQTLLSTIGAVGRNLVAIIDQGVKEKFKARPPIPAYRKAGARRSGGLMHRDGLKRKPETIPRRVRP